EIGVHETLRRRVDVLRRFLRGPLFHERVAVPQTVDVRADHRIATPLDSRVEAQEPRNALAIIRRIQNPDHASVAKGPSPEVRIDLRVALGLALQEHQFPAALHQHEGATALEVVEMFDEMNRSRYRSLDPLINMNRGARDIDHSTN